MWTGVSSLVALCQCLRLCVALFWSLIICPGVDTFFLTWVHARNLYSSGLLQYGKEKAFESHSHLIFRCF